MSERPPVVLYGDEDISPRLVQLLAAEGCYTTCARDRGRLRLPDHQHLAYAASQGMALLTFNREHFEELHDHYQAAGREHAGIIVSEGLQGDAGLTELVQRLLRLLQERSRDEVCNELIDLDDYATTQP
jgi:predicted nuclease of predicted toxin-antitoxin system